jgi:hypothetical protein
MPILPSVYRTLRKNDIHQRPFKAYKNYRIDQNNVNKTGSYVLQKAEHIRVPATLGDSSTYYDSYSNFNIDTNIHVAWSSLDHKYYRYPYDPARSMELTDSNTVSKFLFCSASTIAMPWVTYGERIKPDSLEITSSIQKFKTLSDYSIFLYDDGVGNLRDDEINSSSFAKESHLNFYLTFNNEFRKFMFNKGKLDTTFFSYRLNKMHLFATGSNIEIKDGVSTHAGGSDYFSSGLACKFNQNGVGNESFIRIKNNEVFNNLNRCDQFAWSLWVKPDVTKKGETLITKNGLKREQYLDKKGPSKSELIKFRDVETKLPKVVAEDAPIPNFSKIRTPIHLSITGSELHFQASDGEYQLHLSASLTLRDGWSHVLVQNSESLCKLAINGEFTGSSGSLPKYSMNNEHYLQIGSVGHANANFTYNETLLGSYTGELAEVRLYDYALPQSSITSLANQNFYSGSLYQSNVPGNIFYRNGQLVISSPLQKYNNIFISSSNIEPGTFNIDYKGQHTIYENEFLCRVPKGTCNVSMNPSATYKPATGIDNECTNQEKFNGPGEFRKSMFVSGAALPYITTIGLYDDNARLLAVGKMAEPVQKRNDVDMNFIVRWDY